jgi:hypothetical protein
VPTSRPTRNTEVGNSQTNNRRIAKKEGKKKNQKQAKWT